MSKRAATLGFLLVLAVFSAMAFRGLKTQGLLYHDTGMYLLEAKFLDEGFGLLSSKLRASDQAGVPDWEALRRGMSGTPMRMGKPVLSALLWLSGAVFGFQDDIAAGLTAFCSVVVLVLTFLLAMRLVGASCALFSAALLACSTFNLLYARSGLADPIVSVFLLSALYAYVTETRRGFSFRLYGAGFLLGLAFGSNQWRSAYMPAFVLLLEAMRNVRERRSLRIGLLRAFLIVLGFATPLFLFQLPYTAARMALGPLPFPDYWGQLAGKYTQTAQLTWFEDVGALSRSFWLVEGPLFSALTAAGILALLIRLIRRRENADFLLLFFSLAPFLYFSSMKMCGETLPRTMASLLPLACIAAGRMLSEVLDRGARREGIPLCVAGLLFALLLPHAAKAGRTRSGYAEAARYVQTQTKQPLFILGMEPVWRFYLGKVAHEPYARPNTVQEMIAMGQTSGIDLVMVDFSTMHSKYGMRYTADLVKQYRPLATFDNPMGRSVPHLLDLYGIEAAGRVAGDEASGKIYIFSLRDIAAREG